jgi:hypothetical protein
MTRPARSRKSSFLRQHSLSLIVAAILSSLLVLYSRADPSTHWGSFFGNAVADWTGTLVFIVATKYFFEVGSRESRRPTRQFHQRFAEFLQCHSLTIVLAVTGLAWIYAYAHSEANGKWGQVTGNIVSEWTQVLGLVVATKYFRETKSKE